MTRFVRTQGPKVTSFKFTTSPGASNDITLGDLWVDPSDPTLTFYKLTSTTPVVWTELAPGGNLADGNFGDITVASTGTVWTVNNAAITLSKMANLPPNTLIGNNTGSSGTPIALTVAQLQLMLGITSGTTFSSSDFQTYSQFGGL